MKGTESIDWGYWGTVLQPYLILLTAGLFSLLIVKVLIRIIFKVFFTGLKSVNAEHLKAHVRGPIYFLVPVIAMQGALLGSSLNVVFLDKWLGWALISGLGWLAIRIIDVVAEIIQKQHPIDIEDNRIARSIHTQVQVFKRIAIFGVVVLSIASILITFESVRHVGATLFASAGVAGLVVGIAARPTLSNFIAGIQLALTHPIRIDDVVIVEGEWGRIEEITATYVVVAIWDKRRLILPITYFVEKPFQNWTRTTAELIGTVFVYADYTISVEKVREELKRILESTNLWDKKVCVLQVTESTEKSMQLRALVSAKDAGTAWDLRCYVREKLVHFLQKEEASLPKHRAHMLKAQ